MKTERDKFLHELDGHGYNFICKDWCEESNSFVCDQLNTVWEMWLAAKADIVPEGYCVVPREPSEIMIDASQRRQWDNLSLPMECMDTLKYKAMIEVGELK